MRTITRTYDLFQLAELSAAARDTAYNEWLRTFEYGWDINPYQDGAEAYGFFP